MKKIFTIIFLFFALLSNSYSSDPVWVQDFSSGEPGNWLEYSEYSMDYSYASDGALKILKQSDTDKQLIIATEVLDLSNFIKFEFDMSYQKLVNPNTKVLFGIITDDENPKSSFELIDILPLNSVEDKELNTKEILLNRTETSARLAFMFVGNLEFFGLDNLKIYSDDIKRDRPLAVENPVFTPSDSGELNGVFTWKNPLKDINGDDLETINKIEIYANYELIHTIESPIPGEEVNEAINFDASGPYYILITPYSDAGKGYSAQIEEIWAGLGVPGTVNNLSIKLEGYTATLSWESPTEGQNGGYFDGVIEKYNILRSDGHEFTASGNETSFSDNLSEQGVFNYQITPVNSSGNGETATTDMINFLAQNYFVYDNFDLNSTDKDYLEKYNFFWTLSSTNPDVNFEWDDSKLAKGAIGELLLRSIPDEYQSNETIRCISPAINSSGLDVITIQFKDYAKARNIANPLTLALETSSDNGQTWNEAYKWTVADEEQTNITKILNTPDIGSENLLVSITYKGKPYNISALAYDNIRIFSMGMTDAILTNIEIPAAIAPGDNVTPIIHLENLSVSAKDLKLIVKIIDRKNDKELRSEEYNISATAGQNIIFEDFEFEALEGEFKIQAAIEMEGDESTANNAKTVNFDAFYLVDKELVVIEEFTGVWCVVCPGAAMGLEDMMLAEKPIAVIAYHGNDKYQTSNSTIRNNYYGITGFPTVVFEGQDKIIGGNSNKSKADDYIPFVDEKYETRTAIDLDVSAVYDEGSLSAQAIVKSLSPINSNLHFFAVITESEIQEKWQNQEKLDFVERKVYPNGNGLLIDMSDNKEIIDFNFSALQSFNKEHLELIVFVQDKTTKKIYNGASLKISDLTEVKDITFENSNISLYPVPARDHIIVQKAENYNLTIYSIEGGKAMEAQINNAYFNLDISGLSTGAYIVMLQNSNNILRKVIVVE